MPLDADGVLLQLGQAGPPATRADVSPPRLPLPGTGIEASPGMSTASTAGSAGGPDAESLPAPEGAHTLSLLWSVFTSALGLPDAGVAHDMFSLTASLTCIMCLD